MQIGRPPVVRRQHCIWDSGELSGVNTLFIESFNVIIGRHPDCQEIYQCLIYSIFRDLSTDLNPASLNHRVVMVGEAKP